MNRHSKIIVILFFIFLLATGLFVHQDYGILWDDTYSRKNGFMAIHYILQKDEALFSYRDRYYGFNPYFIELHNVIDNASTGHTAMAREAIKLHLDEILLQGGETLVQEHWERVWTGFLALKPPPRVGLVSSVSSMMSSLRARDTRKEEAGVW